MFISFTVFFTTSWRLVALGQVLHIKDFFFFGWVGQISQNLCCFFNILIWEYFNSLILISIQMLWQKYWMVQHYVARTWFSWIWILSLAIYCRAGGTLKNIQLVANKGIYFLLMFLHLFAGLNNILKAYEDKSAYAMCVFSLALGPNVEPVTFVGKTQVCHATMPLCF